MKTASWAVGKRRVGKWTGEAFGRVLDRPTGFLAAFQDRGFAPLRYAHSPQDIFNRVTGVVGWSGGTGWEPDDRTG